MPNLNDLYDERCRIDKEQRDLNDAVLERDGVYTAEEDEKYDKLDKRFNEVTDQIREEETREEGLKKKAENLAKRDLSRPEKEEKEVRKDPPVIEKATIPEMKVAERYAEAFKQYRTLNPHLATPEYRDAFRQYLRGERRALQADLDTVGGFVATPETFVADLIQDKDRMVFMRRLSRVIPVPKAESLGFPVLDADPAAPVWTNELLIGDEDSSMAFEKRALYPHPIAKYIKISKTLIRKAAINIEALVRERLAYQLAVTEENAFLNGTGVDQPLGVMVSSAAGISSGQDVSTGNTSTEIKADGLINCKYSLEAQYRTNCAWIFHRTAVRNIRKLKYGDGTYIWKPGISSDRPDTILDYPVYESEYQLSTFSASSLVGILGDFSFYWIADALSMTLEVLMELYAATNQNGYVLRAEVDGAPVHEKAFARVKLAA